jgi:hypothetical protein
MEQSLLWKRLTRRSLATGLAAYRQLMRRSDTTRQISLFQRIPRSQRNLIMGSHRFQGLSEVATQVSPRSGSSKTTSSISHTFGPRYHSSAMTVDSPRMLHPELSLLFGLKCSMKRHVSSTIAQVRLESHLMQLLMAKMSVSHSCHTMTAIKTSLARSSKKCTHLRLKRLSSTRRRPNFSLAWRTLAWLSPQKGKFSTNLMFWAATSKH